MRVIPKGDPKDKKDQGGETKAPKSTYMPWDAAMAAIGSGAYDLAGYAKEARETDMPVAQTPAPGTDPVDGSKEAAKDGDVLTNMTPVGKVVDKK